MVSCGLTNVGKVRTTNQDYIFASSDSVGKLNNLFLVADGMGGHKAGDYASRFMIENLVSYIKKSEIDLPVRLLDEGIKEVNRRLYEESSHNVDLNGMGTTLVAATVKDQRLYVANIGDSRLYIARGGELIQITRDHSFVEEMVSRGQMERGSSDYQKNRNIITRALGTQSQVMADYFQVNLYAGDIFLMCSDGLTSMVGDEEINEILGSSANLKEKARELVDAAIIHGGRDNIAVILAAPSESEVVSC